MNNSKNNWLSEQMRLYVAKAITNKGRIICCEKCGKTEGLEFHHGKYSPNEVTIDDIKILCHKCHRNSKRPKAKASQLATIFENNKRFCVVNKFRFEY